MLQLLDSILGQKTPIGTLSAMSLWGFLCQSWWQSVFWEIFWLSLQYGRTKVFERYFSRHKSLSSAPLILKIHLRDQGKQHINSSAHVVLINKIYLAYQKADERLSIRYMLRLGQALNRIKQQHLRCPNRKMYLIIRGADEGAYRFKNCSLRQVEEENWI